MQNERTYANIKTNLGECGEQDSNPWNLTGIRRRRLRAPFKEWEIWEHLGADWLKRWEDDSRSVRFMRVKHLERN